MPLPNYGYFNKEEKKHQDLVFKGAPQIVDMPVEDDYGGPNSRKESRKRGQVTTGINRKIDGWGVGFFLDC